jgi:hypothetical protein
MAVSISSLLRANNTSVCDLFFGMKTQYNSKELQTYLKHQGYSYKKNSNIPHNTLKYFFDANGDRVLPRMPFQNYNRKAA